MKSTFLAGAALLLIACNSGDRGKDRPPSDFLEDTTRDTLIVDSAEASVFREASFREARLAAVDSSIYTINYKVSGFATGDTVQIRLVRDSVAGKVTRISINRNRFVTSGAERFAVDKIYGTQAKYTSCVRLRRTTIKSEICQSWFTNFLAPGKVDTMSVDSSLAIAYVRAIATTSDTLPVQFCLFTKTKDGKFRIAANQRTLWSCQDLYRRFPMAQRFADYRGISFREGHYQIFIDVTKPADKKITVDFVRKTWTPA